MDDNKKYSKYENDASLPPEGSNDDKKRDKKRLLLLLLLFIFVVTACVVGGRQLWQVYTTKLAQQGHDDLLSSVTAEEKSTQPDDTLLPDNPIDFAQLKAINSEIYAWIRVPNTKVDHPVVQSASDDSYYLHRTIKHENLFAGSIYTELANSLDFTDPNTVLYGHNMEKELMFTSLHYFENEQFFNDNEYFYIYTPGHILTYRIVSAHQYDDRHILNSFDFSNKQVFAEYLEGVQNPKSMKRNVRQGIELTTDDKIVTLSTCVSGNKAARYLVQGVLIDDELTK